MTRDNILVAHCSNSQLCSNNNKLIKFSKLGKKKILSRKPPKKHRQTFETMATYTTLAILSSMILARSEIIVNQYTCLDGDTSTECGVVFNDVSGDLKDLVDPFEVEFLLEGASMDGSTWVDDETYPNNGYLLFTVFGGPFFANEQEAGLYKLYDDAQGNVQFEQLINLPFIIDVAYDFENAPNRIYVASIFTNTVFVVDATLYVVIAAYNTYNGQLFAGPDGLYADKQGNIYLTDVDLNPGFPLTQPKLEGGRIFRIDVTDNDNIYEEVVSVYGSVGIDGAGNRVIAANTIDFPDDEYEVFDFTRSNRDLIGIEEYKKHPQTGALTYKKQYYEIEDDPEYFETKPFLDGIAFDLDENVWITTKINFTYSRISIVNDKPEYIGNIEFTPENQVVAIELAGDGYFYGSMVQYPTNFISGKLFRIQYKQKKAKKDKKKKEKRRRKD